MILVQPPSALARAANALEVEQRCYLIIVAIFLAQAVSACAFVHGYFGGAQSALSAEDLDPPFITDTQSERF